ncbi:MAG: tetratricopeptide repeat protein [Flavobacteriia bacterium]|nr:tetratricopeptide repeat protein [Flavobacteriia bacterium]
MKRLLLSNLYLSFVLVVSGQSSADINYISIEPINSSDAECTHSRIKIVPKADAFYDERKFDEALELYKRALSFRKNDEHVIQRIYELEKDLQYDKIVKKADDCYKKRDYKKALELYNRCQTLRKNDQHVTKMIRKTERKLRYSTNSNSTSNIQN